MATYDYRLVNVFTQGRAPLTGNPLCVFERADGLDAGVMQALALQFNLSETTFILPSERASARVRIFTPDFEMPFAGHPTLGTAHVCRALGLGGDTLTLEMQAGIIPVRAQGSRWQLAANAPTWRAPRESPAALAALIGLGDHDVGGRPLWVDTGSRQLMLPIATEAALRRAQLRLPDWSALDCQGGAAMLYAFAPIGGAEPGAGATGQAATRLLARFFFPTRGGTILEDPATGSAAANLGGWWIATERDLPCAFTIAQGEYVGRPSTLNLEVTRERQILVSGEVVELGRGSIEL